MALKKSELYPSLWSSSDELRSGMDASLYEWLGAPDHVVHDKMDRVSQTIAQRVIVFAERYETPLPRIVSRRAERKRK